MRYIVVALVAIASIILAAGFLYFIEELYKDEQLKKATRKTGKCVFCGREVPENTIVCSKCDNELTNHPGKPEDDWYELQSKL